MSPSKIFPKAGLGCSWKRYWAAVKYPSSNYLVNSTSLLYFLFFASSHQWTQGITKPATYTIATVTAKKHERFLLARQRNTQQSFGTTPASHGYYPQDSAPVLLTRSSMCLEHLWDFQALCYRRSQLWPPFLDNQSRDAAKIGKYSIFWVRKSVFFPCLIGWGNSTSALVLTENMCWEF